MPNPNPPEFVPFQKDKYHIPEYYKEIFPLDAIEDYLDIAYCWDLSPTLTMALKYFLRSGRKPGQSREKDLTKAMEMIQRELHYTREKENVPF